MSIAVLVGGEKGGKYFCAGTEYLIDRYKFDPVWGRTGAVWGM